MAKTVLVRVSLVRAALLGASALALFGAPFTIGDAAAKVGVTSATDGDPLGKPPQEAERVLRIGIDVQANELITTNANDRAHLVFLDGSSLTVGPSAQLTIDKFVFDPSTKTGELAINASKGVLRLVGGKISKNNAITITTPSSTIGIRGGITIMDVGLRRTDSTFVFGKDMTVRAAGVTQTAVRPGSMIVTNLGSPPGLPTLLAQGALNAQLSALEGRRAPQGNSSSGGGGGSGRNADQAAQSSGLSTVNSGQSVRIVAPGGTDNFGSGPGPRGRNPNDTVVTALSNANFGVQQNIALQDQKQQQAIVIQQQVDTPAPPLPPPPTSFPTGGAGGPPSSPGQPAPLPVTNLPQTGTVTYVGEMFGAANGRFAGGSYQNAWNFTSRSGAFTATFDNARFQGTTFANGNSNTFNTRGPVASSNANRQMELNGAFFGRGSQPDLQIGSFNVQGPRYNGFGVYYGEKR
ncbi:FecR family protein [Rhodospirillales bacterium URHD0017]|nr:FecR family protein [Rhodospirillales bacterium URHD0017]